MGVEIYSKETAMVILNGISAEYESLLSTMDAIEDDGDLFTFDLIKRRLLQGKQRKKLTNGNTSESALITASQTQHFNRAPLFCLHCKQRGHCESACCDKYPSLRPSHNSTTAPKTQNQDFVTEPRNDYLS